MIRMKIMKIKTFILIILLFGISIVCINKLRKASTEIINVHIIPHTHDDAGWLWSLDEYYYGRNSWGKCVKCILDNMLTSLNSDPTRTFTYVEMVFFEKWYKEQNESTKENIKSLVKEGRLDFANAGWVMNDEATPTYQHIIDQMRLGMQFLKRELDYTPKVAWYIDPFGHSMTNAYLLNKLGFDKLVIVRIDFRDKEKRIKEKTMQFNWRPYYQIDGGKSQIFTHITTGHYSPDTDFFPNLLEVDYNTPDLFKNQLEKIYNYFNEMSNAYPTKELMFLFGDDFTFLKANQNYLNIEAMIKAFEMSNTYKDKINFIYSTPTKYFNALDKKLNENKISLKSFDDHDFFPYSEFKWDYWTGYFTSRPYLKGIVRDAGKYLDQTDKLLINHLIKGKVNNIDEHLNNLDQLRRELAIAQHHDGVSGTAREAVSVDYINRIKNGITKSNLSIMSLIEEDLKTFKKGKFESICLEAASEIECNQKVYTNDQLSKGILIIYINPGIVGNFPVRIKVKTEIGIIIKDQSGIIENDLICDHELDYCVINLILNFSKDELYKFVEIKSDNNSSPIEGSSIDTINEIKLIDNEKSVLIFNTKNLNFIEKIKNSSNSSEEEYSISITHGYYEYHWWKDPIGKNRQGAYLLATDEETPKKYNLNREKSKFYIGNKMSEIDLIFENSKIKLRIYKNDLNYIIDTESIIFPYHAKIGLEFLLIINSNINNLNKENLTEFHTDTNGMRMIKRIKNTRETYDFKVDDKVASNFYPVNSLIIIKDNKSTLNIFNDRSQSASSLNKGEVFFILNRWSQRDDRKGLADGVDEFNSSEIYFHLNHWIALGDNNLNKDKLYDFINKKPLYVVYSDIQEEGIFNNEISKLFLKKIEKEMMNEDLIYNLDDEDCIEVNYYFINKEKLLVQFMNKLDPFIYKEKSCKVNIKQNQNFNVKRVGLNGIDEVIEK